MCPAVLIACSEPACENTVLVGKPSPDGALIAFVYNRRCGSARESTDVSVIGFHDSLRDQTGNVLSVGAAQPVKVSWLGPKELQISGFVNPFFKRTEPIDSVTLAYP